MIFESRSEQLKLSLLVKIINTTLCNHNSIGHWCIVLFVWSELRCLCMHKNRLTKHILNPHFVSFFAVDCCCCWCSCCNPLYVTVRLLYMQKEWQYINAFIITWAHSNDDYCSMHHIDIHCMLCNQNAKASHTKQHTILWICVLHHRFLSCTKPTTEIVIMKQRFEFQ